LTKHDVSSILAILLKSIEQQPYYIIIMLQPQWGLSLLIICQVASARTQQVTLRFSCQTTTTALA